MASAGRLKANEIFILKLHSWPHLSASSESRLISGWQSFGFLGARRPPRALGATRRIGERGPQCTWPDLQGANKSENYLWCAAAAAMFSATTLTDAKIIVAEKCQVEPGNFVGRLAARLAEKSPAAI